MQQEAKNDGRLKEEEDKQKFLTRFLASLRHHQVMMMVVKIAKRIFAIHASNVASRADVDQ